MPVKTPLPKALSAPSAAHPEMDALIGNLGQRVKALRSERSWSLEDLAQASGVSKSMLSEIEREQANPTLSVISRIAQAYDMSLLDLISLVEEPPSIRVIRAEDRSQIFRSDQHCQLRTLSPLHRERETEFYELVLRPGSALTSPAHTEGVRELLTVREGRVEVKSGELTEEILRGDSAAYQADLPHSITNIGPEDAVLYLVVTYP